MAGDHHQTSNAEIAENDTDEGSTAVHRPRGCHNLEPSVYNVASWKQLCGLDVVNSPAVIWSTRSRGTRSPGSRTRVRAPV